VQEFHGDAFPLVAAAVSVPWDYGFCNGAGTAEIRAYSIVILRRRVIASEDHGAVLARVGAIRKPHGFGYALLDEQSAKTLEAEIESARCASTRRGVPSELWAEPPITIW
jgi:hypothetical protein